MTNTPVELTVLEVGKRYILDADFSNSSEIILLRQTGLFALVIDPDDESGTEWWTMKSRLIEKKSYDSSKRTENL